MKKIALILIIMTSFATNAQELMTPELLWKLGRISPLGVSKNGKNIVYKVSTPSIEENTSNSKYYSIPISGGKVVELKEHKGLVNDKNISPNGDWTLSHKEVKTNKVDGKDFYPELDKSDVKVYESLDYRHWDTYNEGKHNHVILTNTKGEEIDIMEDEPFDSPQKAFGGDEDYIWSPDSSKVIYVSKKKVGTAYATSTNTDLYEYDLASKTTKNLTESNLGYDVAPQFSPNGDLSWLQMKRDGFEADKNDIIVRFKGLDINLTSGWDGTVDSFTWSKDGKKVYFLAPVDGTKQLFEVNFPGLTRIAVLVTQITEGQFDVNQIIGFHENNVLVTRGDMNHANEIFSYDLKKKSWKQITNINTEVYSKLALPKVEKRMVKTTDGKEMLVWVILPPNFDAKKKCIKIKISKPKKKAEKAKNDKNLN